MEEEEGLGQGRPVRKVGEWAGGGKLRKRMSKNVLSHARGEKWACLVLLLLLLLWLLQVGAASCKTTAFTVVYLFKYVYIL